MIVDGKREICWKSRRKVKSTSVMKSQPGYGLALRLMSGHSQRAKFKDTAVAYGKTRKHVPQEIPAEESSGQPGCRSTPLPCRSRTATGTLLFCFSSSLFEPRRLLSRHNTPEAYKSRHERPASQHARRAHHLVVTRHLVPPSSPRPAPRS